ncbi:hypothetical protein D3C86_1038720 [compost metagenome]
MFSTSTMASSTSSPMAIASPPRVMVLTEIPKAFMNRKVTTNERGMAVRVMKVVRKFNRKRKSTISTRIAPSRRASSTLATDASMKCAWRNRSPLRLISAGRVRLRSAST